MNIFSIFQLFGGLGLFIFGMGMMSDGLQQGAGNKLKNALAKLTTNQVSGLLVGTAVATLIHSSATTVMLVGFINAGLMNLTQSIGVMLGANIGTSLSMQLVSFDLAVYAPLAIAIGVLMGIITERDKWKYISYIILGFGLLFLGMSVMKEAVTPLKHSVAFKELLSHTDGTTLSGMLLGILVTTAITGVVQSSGAIIGILFTFASTGIFTEFSQIFPLVLGAKIGTCATPLLGSIGTGLNAKRSAFSHLFYNIFGAILAILMYYFYEWLIPSIGGNLSRQIANFNTILQITNSIIMLFFVKYYVRFIKFVIRGKEEIEEKSHLDPILLKTPELALYATIKELRRSLLMIRRMFKHAIKGFIRIDQNEFNTVSHLEKMINDIKTATTSYIALTAERNLSKRQAILVQQAHTIMKNIERIGDHIDNISSVTHDKNQRDVWFSNGTMERIIALYLQADKAIALTCAALSPKSKGDLPETRKAYDEYLIQSNEMREYYRTKIETHKEHADAGLLLTRYMEIFDKVVNHSNNVFEAQMDPLFYIKEYKYDKIKSVVNKVPLEDRDSYHFKDDLVNDNDSLVNPV